MIDIVVPTRVWKAADIVRHFKGNMYMIVCIAKDSTDLRDKVVYKHIGGNGELWVRDLEEFNSEVDHEKYPDVKQKYRFELVETHD
jgi:hypothetical protein